MIELDNNATSRPCPEAIEAAERAMRELWHNPSSVHRAGQAARNAVELARRDVAALIGASPREVTFTSGATESLMLAMRGLLASRGSAIRARTNAAPVVVASRVEHAAIRDQAEAMSREGLCEVVWCAVDREGRITPDALRAVLSAHAGCVALVALGWANNETGVVQRIDELSVACREAGTILVCDATQWVGKMPTDVGTAGFGAGAALSDDRPGSGLDVMALSAHKWHGLKGVGMLWVRRGVTLTPVTPGSHELGRRGGTENVPGILAAGAAARAATAWLESPEQRGSRRGLRNSLEQGILQACPGAAVNGVGAERLWNTTNIAFPRLEAEGMLMLLSERGLNASAGAACSSGSLEPSPVLLAMGVPEALAHGSVRFSLSRDTTREEVERAVEVVAECAGRLSRSMPGAG
ncbi:MAG: cysteine desulfurase family protein [Phycisphaerales bacterium]|jgi:cysteine desulfurase|nr:cysteine desulfurase family protein [Phycisphaerales bacterium]